MGQTIGRYLYTCTIHVNKDFGTCKCNSVYIGTCMFTRLSKFSNINLFLLSLLTVCMNIVHVKTQNCKNGTEFSNKIML